MTMSAEERHQIENEMLYRRMNEKVGDDLGALDAAYIESNEMFLIRDEDLLINFKCECSDENCSQRIPMKLEEYQSIHSQRSTFVVKVDHQVEPIEDVIKREDGYSVVRKINKTPAPAQGSPLNETNIDNSTLT
ncbi:MAG: hypothetical protein QFB86_00250 [Patescibacteria group bacterium]|nr:hypothetical protein [Patescibacteria group bacterium]